MIERDAPFLILVFTFIAFLLEIYGVVSLPMSFPLMVFSCGMAAFITWLLAPQLLEFIRSVLLKRRLQKIESRFPGARATELSNGSILLTDRTTGATLQELQGREKVIK